MVSPFTANMQQPMYRSAALNVDTSHSHKFFEDDNNVLDDNILDNSAIDSGLELSPPMADSRRESFAVSGPPLFSPKTDDWHSVDMQSIPSNNPFFDQTSNNPFMRHEQNLATSLAAPSNNWAATPFSQIDGFQPDYDSSASMFRMTPSQTPFSHPGNMFANVGSANRSISSPHNKDMAGINGKKTHPGSPIIRSHNDLRRGDGIRKKNARFEIPAERNLSNIDSLIAQSTDETEIKELKQQKRLLRNRQAALDSRQRKKQHTERLEDEKKQFTSIITDLEEEINALKTKMEMLLHENQSYAEYTENLTMERDEMIRAHTNETGDLRKKITVLTDHVQRLETNTTPAPNPNSFSGAYGDMEDLAMDGTWDQSNFMHDYPAEPEIKPEMSLITAKKNDTSYAAGAANKSSSQQGGMLFMLFLVGAFVLSSRSTPAIPRVPENVRAEAATLLNNVMKDAGLGAPPTNIQSMPPQPSGSWTDSATSIPMADMNVDGGSGSMLHALGDSLTQPTQEQTNEQLFSLSAQQYNGVLDQNFIHNNQPERFHSQGRRNLAEALAAMSTTDKQNGAAEVYTRSLLWDQIPREVVRNFAKMVAECNSAQTEQQCNEAIS